jgi:hypothetical protein
MGELVTKLADKDLCLCLVLLNYGLCIYACELEIVPVERLKDLLGVAHLELPASLHYSAVGFLFLNYQTPTDRANYKRLGFGLHPNERKAKARKK